MRGDLFSRYLVAVVANLCLLLSSQVVAGPKWALGLVWGDPSLLLVTFSPKERIMLDGGVSWPRHDEVLLLSDCKFTSYLTVSSLDWRLYYGIGGYFVLNPHGHEAFGARIPLGMSYKFPHTSFEAFAELAPALQIVPKTKGRLQGGLGVRIWL
jgi:hypothetical protein